MINLLRDKKDYNKIGGHSRNGGILYDKWRRI